MVKRFIFGIIAVITLSVALLPALTTPAVAASPLATTASTDCGQKSRTFLLMPTWYKYLDFDPDCSVKFDKEITKPCATGGGVCFDTTFNFDVIWLIAFAVIEILLTLAGIVAFVFVMIGGFKFVTSQGSPDAIVKARKTLANAIVGAILAVIAGRTVSFVAGKLSNNAGRLANGWGLVDVTDTSNTLATITNYALTILGALSVITMIIAGIQFMVSSANPDKVKKARSAIYFALAGLAIAILASTIINFVIGKTT